MPKKKPSRFSRCCFRAVLWMVRTVYPRIGVEGAENLPEEPCIVVGNHSQIHGPIACELYFPGERAIWCAGQMMELREVPAYAYADFWCEKPRWSKWFFKLLSYLIAPLSVCLFNNAHTIPVYHDTRVLSTFHQTIAALKAGANIVIFPECAQKHNHIVNVFQDRFVDVARMYYKRSGVKLNFVPMYVCPSLHKLVIGTPTVFDPEQPIEAERGRICAYITREITALAEAQPAHVVVPYNNVSRRNYPTNRAQEVAP